VQGERGERRELLAPDIKSSGEREKTRESNGAKKELKKRRK
jgi:hypothetical protein